MRITSLEIDGYGVWHGLRAERLTEGINVVYGPNEAGKSTLLQFVRSVLYGFSPERRRYFPPTHGGRPGGSMEVATPNGRFQIDRYDDPSGPPGSEQLIITAADGTRQGEHMIKVLLSNLDESIFNNVFAVGLREIQELGTLGDAQSAELLYNITAGLDRVSLVEVMRELETLRNRILDRNGGTSRIGQLLADRERLRQEIEELESLPRRYSRLAAERGQLDREIIRLEEEKNRADRQSRIIDLATGVRELWMRRMAADNELAALGPQPAMPADAVPRLDAINARMQKYQSRVERFDRQREELRQEAAGLEVNESLGRQAARIEALAEQESWIETVQKQVDSLEKEVAELWTSVAVEHERLGLGKPTGPENLPNYSTHALARLRSPARALRKCHDQAKQAQREAVVANDLAASLQQQITAALNARQDRELTAATDRAGNLVAQLRRRIQIDERLDQMTRYEKDLEEQGQHLLDQQLLPIWVLVSLGAVLMLGLVLLVAGLFMPATLTGSIGWALAILGLLSIVAAGSTKVVIERANARQLAANQKQLHMLQLQIKQAKDDCAVLDGQLPRGGGPIVSRLSAAEKDLASLEELAPVDTRRAAAQQEASAAAARVTQAENDVRAARRRWRESLAAADLPQTLTSQQVKKIAQRWEQIHQTQRRMVGRQEELIQRRRELEMLVGRIAQLVADCGVEITAKQPIEQLRQLAAASAHQQAQLARQEAIRRQSRELRRHRARQEEAIRRLKHRRRDLFHQSGVENEQELRRRAVEAARVDVLRRERDSLGLEISRTVGDYCSQELLRQQLEGDAAGGLESRREEARTRLTAIEQELRDRLEKRGQMVEQMRALAEDRQLAERQLDLAVLEKRLEEAVRRWQVLAVTCRILEKIRTTYEHERQPETLREASGYLDRLTQGRYVRVWTPLEEHVLRVDDAEGRSVPVEVLSRGTREQLFLSLRLALAAWYARRGTALPLVLDDVLVNFDADRAKAAAAVLRDFAATGHQLLVFTCHEHIAKVFKSLKVPVSSLPDNAEGEHAPLVFEEPLKDKVKRARKTPSPTRKPAGGERIASSEEDDFEDEADDSDDDSHGDSAHWEEAYSDDDAEDLWEEDDSDEHSELDGDAGAAA